MKNPGWRLLSPSARPFALTAVCAGCLAAQLPAVAETVYPVFDPNYTVAAARHAGENFFGSTGPINKHDEAPTAFLTTERVGTAPADRGVLRFRWLFAAADRDEFAGIAFALRRPRFDTVKTTGERGPAVTLPSVISVNLRRLTSVAVPAVKIEAIRLQIGAPQGAVKCTLKVEVLDSANRRALARIAYDPAARADQTLTVPLTLFRGVFDYTHVVQIALLIEERNVAAHVVNPAAGMLDIQSLALVDSDGVDQSAGVIAALPDAQFAYELARREFETLWRLADAKTGYSWDRTLTPDQLDIGSTGWLMASLSYAVEQGWVTRAEATLRALKILRWSDHPTLFHNKPTGALGNSAGVFYHFLGYWGAVHPLTGTRKLDYHNVNSVEASVLDTALFQYGVAQCETAFNGKTRAEVEIRTRCRNILNRTQWDQLKEPMSGQLYLSWKPVKDDTTVGHYFAAPALFGGFWASFDAEGMTPLTIDNFTAEGQIAALLAIGSPTHPTTTEPWYRMQRMQRTVGGHTVIVSSSGSFFTALFGAGLLPPFLGPDHGVAMGAAADLDSFQNMSETFEAHRAVSPPGTIVLPDAVELPNTVYLAQANLALALAPEGADTGTGSPYSLEMAAGLGGAPATEALGEMKRLFTAQPALFHPLFGVADAYHFDLASFPQGGLTRTQGTWIQGQKFTLNAGAGLIGLLNFLTDGGVAAQAATHRQLGLGLERVFAAAPPPAVPANPSVVTVSGYQVKVQRRQSDNTLAAPVALGVRGVNWSPASPNTNTSIFDPQNANVRRPEFGKWRPVDLPLMQAMHVNVVRLPIDLGYDATHGPIGRALLDDAYAHGIYVLMTVDDGVNNLVRVRGAVNYYKNHPAILGWVLGNEWNINRYYGVASSVANAAQRTQTAAALIKTLDANHPVFSSYGEIDINDAGRHLADTAHYVNDICKSVDGWLLNIYRGNSFGNLFTQWASISPRPMLIGEFGTDAFHTTTVGNPNPPGQVDEQEQRTWDLGLWKEIHGQLSASNPANVSAGGFAFEWNDEHWKIAPPGSQETGGWIANIFPDGEGNEEYFGIVDINRKPRAVYFGLQTAYDPAYVPGP